MKWATKQNGFTIVELLIVVVVIAILAAITIVAYNGITQRSKESSVTSEISQGVKKLESYRVTSGTDAYPDDAAAAGIANIPGLEYFHTTSNPKAYCLQSTDGTIVYSATNVATTPKSGACTANGLVGWWRLNGNGNDDSGNNWTATLTGSAAAGQNTQPNNAFQFSGTAPSGSVAGSTGILPSEFTISFWYYANAWNTGAATTFISKRSGASNGIFIARLTAANELIVDCGGSGNRWAPGLMLPLNTWIHLAMTCTPSSVGVHMQGSYAGSVVRSVTNLSSSAMLQFGQDDTQYALNGRMDDIRLYNRILSETEVTRLFTDNAQ